MLTVLINFSGLTVPTTYISVSVGYHALGEGIYATMVRYALSERA